MKKILSLAIVMVMALSFVGCGNKEAKNSDGVKVKSLGVEFKYDKAPKRVVALGYDSTEIMIKLGLEDRIIAIATSEYSKDSIRPEYYKKIKDKKILPDGNWPGVPSLETILAEKPDFVYGTGYSFTEKSCGKVQDFTKEKINIYATEGTVKENPDIDSVYNDIQNIGKIFRVEKKANEIVKDMKERVDKIEKKIKDRKTVKSMILEGVTSNKIQVDSGKTFGSKMLERAGGENIFKNLKEPFPTVSIDQIISKNPSHIVVVDLPATPAKNTIKNLEKIKELKGVDAIKNKRYIIVPSLQLFPSAQSIEGIEKIAKGFFADLFK